MRLRHKDVRAIAELSWELLQKYFKRFQEPPFPAIKIEKRKAGRYSRAFHNVSIPTWIFREHEAFIIYYVTHELLHAFIFPHNEDFKKAEAAVLEDWGIGIRHSRAYPRSLSMNGQQVYERPIRLRLRKARRAWQCSKCKWLIEPGDDYFHRASERFCMGCTDGLI